MSIKYVQAAIRVGSVTSTQKLVLIALADCLNEKNGGFCFPSLSRLSSVCCCSVSTVRRALSELEQIKLITRKSIFQNGELIRTEYALLLDVTPYESLSTNESEEGVSNLNTRVSNMNTGGVNLEVGCIQNAQGVYSKCTGNKEYNKEYNYLNIKQSTNEIDPVPKVEPLPKKETTQKQEVKKKSTKGKRQALVKPDDVTQETFDEFVTYRRTEVKHPLTERGLKNLQSEAKKAGITTEQAMKIVMAREWRGFMASWNWQDSLPSKPKSYPKQVGYTPFYQDGYEESLEGISFE